MWQNLLGHCSVLTKVSEAFAPHYLAEIRHDMRQTTLGQISKSGMEVRYTPSGTPCASFTLIVSEQGQDGKVHDIYIPCECWGKKAEAAGELEAGQLILFEGRLRSRRKGEAWEMCVSGFEAQPLTVDAAPAARSNNEKKGA